MHAIVVEIGDPDVGHAAFRQSKRQGDASQLSPSAESQPRHDQALTNIA
jgi:hypothetical protein